MYQKWFIYRNRYTEKMKTDSGGGLHPGEEKGRGQVLRKKKGVAGHRHGVFKDVVQFPHVARPGVRKEDLFKLRGKIPLRLPALRGKLRQGPVRDLPAVPPPVAQGGDPDRDHVDPVVEIRAELPLPDEFLDVSAGRRAAPGVDPPRGGPAAPLPPLLLHDPPP